jgi:nucleotide-binding universal stress UspA family protein
LAVAVARGVHDGDPIGGRMRILAPVTGTTISKHAAEVSIELARAAHADLTILYVSRAQPPPDAISQRRRRLLTRRHEEAVLREIVEVADHYEVRVRTKIKRSDHIDRSWRRHPSERSPALRQHRRSIA